MRRSILLFLWIALLMGIVGCSKSQSGHFVLSSGDEVASVYILPGETEYVRLAVKDLISDVEKITGKKPFLINEMGECGQNCIVIGTKDLIDNNEGIRLIAGNSLESLSGKWEAYLVKYIKGEKNYLVISGSDYRGTMFGIYDFCESYLGVDPMYFWKDREPAKQKKVSWAEVDIVQEEPTFKYRGWFINDEDLFTEWMNGAGPRFIDYPFYSQVANPQIIEKAVESMLRLRYNLIIPASFIDIGNPPEKQLVDIASKRGVFLSMHHIEPMGVSAFTFFNYWKARGKDLKFSYYSHPKEMKEVWQAYAEKWVQYPNVIWQIGLRGIADRPMWQADPSVPQSDAERGRLISEAMKVQMDIIQSVDKRENIPVTTTLWMEGSNLNKEGFLTFPENVMVIFSDNSPGWVLQPDFYETIREPGRKYGIYYHHALWGSGPHLAQGVSPLKNHEIFKLAVDRQSNQYAILNVSNVREFAMGLKASSEMLYNFSQFNPDEFLASWCTQNFGKAAKEAEVAYRQFFNSYQVHGEPSIVFLLDGQMRQKGLGLMRTLKQKLTEPEKSKKDDKVLADSRVGEVSFADLDKKVTIQKEGIEQAGKLAEKAMKRMDGQSLAFFEVNFVAQQKILLGITTWLNALVKATVAEDSGERAACISSLEEAVDAFSLIQEGKALASRGEKWENWYRGDKKMNLPSVEKTTKELLETAKSANLEK